MEIVKEYAIDMKTYLDNEIAQASADKGVAELDKRSKQAIYDFFGKSIGQIANEYVHAFVEGVPHYMIRALFERFVKPTREMILFSKLQVKSVLYPSVDSTLEHPVTLSGLLIVPQGNAGNPAVAMLGYQHGTMLSRNLAPSCFNPEKPFQTTIEVIFGMLFASLNGYAVVMADYQGLGCDDSTQPFMCRKPLARSVLDLLVATREYLETQGDVLWNQQLFLMGYSQGGYVTMATARELQENQRYADLRPHLQASAPCAGPYSLSGVMRFLMLRKEIYPLGIFLIMTIQGYDAALGEQCGDGIFSKEKALKPEYRYIWDLSNGSRTFMQVNKAMPAIPRDIFTDEFIRGLADVNSPVVAVLKDNDLFDWKPETPMHLYQSPRDGLIPFDNAIIADRSFKEKGVPIGLVPMFFLPIDLTSIPIAWRTHIEAGLPCLLAAYSWLTPFRYEQTENGTLKLGDFMLYGQNLYSKNKQYCLRYQLDGDLALYRLSDGQQLWQANVVQEDRVVKYTCTIPRQKHDQYHFKTYDVFNSDLKPVMNPGLCILQQENGNLTLYDNAGKVLWATVTSGINNQVVVGDDGTLVIMDEQGSILWRRA